MMHDTELHFFGGASLRLTQIIVNVKELHIDVGMMLTAKLTIA